MKKNNLFNSIVSLIISQVIVKIFGLVYKLYLANKTGFGDAGNAIYNSGYQIYVLLLTVSSIGVPNAVAKLISEKYYSGDKYEVAAILKSSMFVFAVIGAMFSVVLAVSSEFVSSKLLNINEAKYSIIALSPAIFNVCLISVFRGFYNGTQNIKITAKSQTIEQILKTAFTILLVEFVFVLSKSNTTVMAAFANFATTLATLCSFIYLYKKNSIAGVKVKIKISSMKRILKISFPISLSAILGSLNKNIDSVTVVRFLKTFLTDKKAKIQYGILSGKVDVISSVPVSFVIAIATTIIPTVSMLSVQGKKEKLQKFVKTYMLFTLVLIIPCCIGMYGFSKQILQLLFRSSEGYFLFQISAISMFFIAVEQINNAVLQGIGKVYVPTFSLVIGVFIKFILNILLIKIPSDVFIFGGTAGACLATLICHMIACSISFFIMKKKINLKLEILKYLLKPIISSGIMLMCLYSSYFFLKCIIIENIAIILAILIAVVMYVSSIFILRIFSYEELSLIPFMSNFVGFNKKMRKK